MATFNDHLIPYGNGNSIGRGWRTVTDHKPMGVTWHWTAGRTLAECRRILGGPNAERKGVASAHYGVGRTAAEGIDRYVGLGDQSWHAGKNQVMRWDGKRSNNSTKGSRTTIGIETVHLGYARKNFPAEDDWIEAVDTNNKWEMKIQPWTAEQMDLMVAVTEEILDRWPHIRYRDHHGHHDICPGYKSDVAGLDFAAVLRRAYSDNDIPDVWTPFRTVKGRQQALIDLGYDLGRWGADGDWGDVSSAALNKFQEDRGAVVNGFWTTFTGWDMFDAYHEKRLPWPG